MLTSKVMYKNALSKAHEDRESYDIVNALIDEYFAVMDHMKATSLYDVFMYEKRTTESFALIATQNDDLKQEVNELRKRLGLGKKYRV